VPHIDITLPDGGTQLDTRTAYVSQVTDAAGKAIGTCAQLTGTATVRCPMTAWATADPNAPSVFAHGATVTAKIYANITKATTIGVQSVPATFSWAQLPVASSAGTTEVLDPTKPILRIDPYTAPDPTASSPGWAVVQGKLDVYADQLNRLNLRVDSIGAEDIPAGSTFHVSVQLPEGAQYQGIFGGSSAKGTWEQVGAPSPESMGNQDFTTRQSVNFTGTVTEADGLQSDESFPDLAIDTMQLDNRTQVNTASLDVTMTADAKAFAPDRIEHVEVPKISLAVDVNAPQPTGVLVPTLQSGKGLIKGQDGIVNFAIQNTSPDRNAPAVTGVLTIPAGITATNITDDSGQWEWKTTGQGDGTAKLEFAHLLPLGFGATSSTIAITAHTDAGYTADTADFHYQVAGLDTTAAKLSLDVGDPLAPSAGADQSVTARSSVRLQDGTTTQEATTVSLDGSGSTGGFPDKPLKFTWEQLCIGASNPDQQESDACQGRTGNDTAVTWLDSKDGAGDAKALAKPRFTVGSAKAAADLAFRLKVASEDITSSAVTHVHVDVDAATAFAAGITSTACSMLTAAATSSPGAIVGPANGIWRLNLTDATRQVTGTNCADSSAQLTFTGGQVLLNGGVSIDAASGVVTNNEVKITAGNITWNSHTVGPIATGSADAPTALLKYDGTYDGGMNHTSADGDSPLVVGDAVSGGTAHIVINPASQQVASLKITGATVRSSAQAEFDGSINLDGSFSLTASNGSGKVPVVGVDVTSLEGTVTATAQAVTTTIDLKVVGDLTASGKTPVEIAHGTTLDKITASVSNTGLAFSGRISTLSSAGPPAKSLQVALSSGVGTDSWDLAPVKADSSTALSVGAGSIPVSAVSGSIRLTRAASDPPADVRDVLAAPNLLVTFDTSGLVIDNPAGAHLAFGPLAIAIGSNGPTVNGQLTTASDGLNNSLTLRIDTPDAPAFAIEGGLGKSLANDSLGANTLPISSVVGTLTAGACPGTSCGKWVPQYQVLTAGQYKWGDVTVTGGSSTFSNTGDVLHIVGQLPLQPTLSVPITRSLGSWSLDHIVDWTNAGLFKGSDPMHFTGAQTTSKTQFSLAGTRSGGGGILGKGNVDATSMSIVINAGQITVNLGGRFGTTALASASFQAVVTYQAGLPSVTSTTLTDPKQDASLRAALLTALGIPTAQPAQAAPNPTPPSSPATPTPSDP
ncbi:MAG: hypothetical protein WCP28_20260, partial [Actinomycetes bacterium]